MYQVEFRSQAAREFEKLDQAVADRILKKLRWLAENFESITEEPLTGRLAGLLKLRAGDYRVIYQADQEKRVLIVRLVGHRGEVYDQPLPN